MFGHKEGKIENDLREVVEGLEKLRTLLSNLEFSRKVTIADTAPAQRTITEMIKSINNSIELSQRIREFIEREL